MISRRQLVVLGLLYTVLIVVTVAVMPDPPAAPIFGVAVAWFSIGRAWDRLPIPSAPLPDKPMKWGRQ